MKNSLLLSIILTLWAAPSLAYEDSDAILIGSGDELPDPDYPVYEESCDEQRLRDPSMSDEEYATFLFHFQETDCAYTFKLGDTGFGGGRVFHLTDEGRHGLETSPVQIKAVEWGCHGTKVVDAGDSSIGAGKANTDAVIAEACDSYFSGDTTGFDALRDYKVGGFKDWYVPSEFELHKIYEVLGVHKVLERSDYAWRYPQFFWSSTEADYEFSYAQNLMTGRKEWVEKPLQLSLLPIRSF
ncbi:trimeric autotransporter adhesin [Bathymodiolus platifrons methanotrophic gill symbiont]|uniref:hypothetical protein n=1 Tax=Bathymodiolus platifrons methanotrophic gill symbiont TaxID=113268 RepID=UPI001B76DEF4|nr:hypothetical protein [Bathymodiolus platifrons methanotrophic gill symbiont]GFO75082.1 trimeric autotransporter adhesin [Bathymodiolus platifrons methanotrophic gill symbiont]